MSKNQGFRADAITSDNDLCGDGLSVTGPINSFLLMFFEVFQDV